ncbi:MAG: hypothetical protein HKP30_18525, partial [Myxococcales bacterium]|nr:hypothetical protein [Myxococcales bacterium]
STLAAGAPGKFRDAALTPRTRTSRLIGIGDTPPFEILGENFSFNTAFAPLLDYRFAVKQDSETTSGGDSSGVDATVLMWRPKDKVQGLGLLASVANESGPVYDRTKPRRFVHDGLPFRPTPLSGVKTFSDSRRVATGLFTPSAAMRRLDARHNVDRYDQNFSQSELEWNFGASQDEYVLREAYVDMNLFDSRLFIRAGKQTIIWGKTELFRNMDQFNPSDLAIVTLPDLEESRIPLAALRGIWSFWDVGPFDDVRLEIAWMMDDFEPNDLGRCGEPYAPLPVCDKTFGVFQHGVLGAGLVGETRPPNWWEDLRGVEIGARLEFRWDRFSFAITDFWHWEDSAVPRIFNQFGRRVDPESGRPIAALAPPDARCTTGAEPDCLRGGLTGANNAFDHTSLNRQLYDVICASSVGFFDLDPSVCALTITNSTQFLLDPVGGLLITVATVGQTISATAGGNGGAAGLIGGGALVGLLRGLNADDCDNEITFNAISGACPGAAPSVPLPAQPGGFVTSVAAYDPTRDSPYTFNSGGLGGLRDFLTDQQEALLGCGPFYGSDCDRDGVDLFNAEASVVFETWTGQTRGAPVGTRFVNGRTVMLPGSRGPGDAGYDPRIDGCVRPVGAALDPFGICAAAATLVDPVTLKPFRSELTAVSYNALLFVAALDVRAQADPMFGSEIDPRCGFPTVANPNAPIFCPTIQDFFSVTQTTRPDLRAGGNGQFGRRDFAWAGAGEIILEYDKVNTFGIAVDFSEDVTATNWGMEFTWTASKDFTNSEVPSLRSDSDVLALTVSVDRPTFIRFLNRERTFFFNMQWFVEYIPDHVGKGPDDRYRGYAVDGPVTALGVFTFETGYFQDRLQPSATFVYDVGSESGAVVLDVKYRFSSNASVTVGMNHFYGPGGVYTTPIGLGALGESNQSWRSERYNRLNAVRERDELFVRFRRTF